MVGQFRDLLDVIASAPRTIESLVSDLHSLFGPDISSLTLSEQDPLLSIQVYMVDASINAKPKSMFFRTVQILDIFVSRYKKK